MPAPAQHGAATAHAAEASETTAGSGPSGMIVDVKRYSTHDGPGIRTTVFFAGCPLRCAWCHNPEAVALGGAQAAEARAMLRERGASPRWIGCVAASRVMAEIERDVPYYDRSGGGATFSGGEPLGQPGFLLALLRLCRQHDIHTAVDTTGRVPPDIIRAAAPWADLFLYDLKLMDAAAHRHFTGASNELILSNLELLDELGADVWIRIPWVPGASATPANLRATIAFLSQRTRFRHVSLLPYHRIGEAKYARLGQEFRMAGVAPPSPAEVEAASLSFQQAGFDVSVGH